MTQRVVCSVAYSRTAGFSESDRAARSRVPFVESLWHCCPHGEAVKGRKAGTGADAGAARMAADRPKSWHPIATLPETQRAAELLARRGVIEIRRTENQCRLKPTQ
jgi:hypothetical protein